MSYLRFATKAFPEVTVEAAGCQSFSLVRETSMPVSARPFALRCVTWDSTRSAIWCVDAGSLASEALVRLAEADFTHQALVEIPNSSGSYNDYDLEHEAGNDRLWVPGLSGVIYEVNPTSGAIVSSFTAPGSVSGGIAHDGTDLWLGNPNNGQITKVTTAGSVLDSFNPGGYPAPFFLTYDSVNDHLWVSDSSDDVVFVYNAATYAEIRQLDFSVSTTGTRGISLDGSTLWRSVTKTGSGDEWMQEWECAA